MNLPSARYFSREELRFDLTKLMFDPQTMPIESLGGEGAVQAERLNVGWLRQRFANPPLWASEQTDEHLLRDQSAPLTPAAVLVPIVDRADGLTLLFTQRSANLTDHAGQISFPGGRREEGDASSIDTALRETEEEVGLDRRYVQVLGVLPDYMTVTGYQVTPVVAIVEPPFSTQVDPQEVTEIFEVPLSFLMNGANHQRRVIELPRVRRTFYAMPYDRFFIWGATAGMLRNLFHFLRA